MPTKLTLDEMAHLAQVHTVYEFSHEIEPLMATVHSDPCWMIEPLGCKIQSREGVSQMYQRMFSFIDAMADPEVINTWFSDDGFIGEVRLNAPTSEGGLATTFQFAWSEFTGDLISGEGNYFDLEVSDYVSQVLGADFFKLPGVTLTPEGQRTAT